MIDIALARKAGISEANILKYLELYHAEHDAQIREQNRIRQQNQRARNASTRDVTLVTRDERDAVNALSLVSKNIKETKKERGGFVCPLDFKPNDGDYHVGEDYGHSRIEVDARSVGMMEWSHANRNRAVARKLDWHLTLRGFLRRNGKHSVEPARGLTPEEYHRKYTQGNGNGQAAETGSADGGRIASTDHEEELFPTRSALYPGRTSRR